LHYACSRCAHRQAEDARCGGCGHDVVQDMRDTRALAVLYDAESRWQRRRQGRVISTAAVVGVIPFFPTLFMIGGIWNAFIVAGVTGMGALAVLERSLGARRKFPYLDDYEKRS
jgi:hypothetical protein